MLGNNYLLLNVFCLNIIYSGASTVCFFFTLAYDKGESCLRFCHVLCYSEAEVSAVIEKLRKAYVLD